MNTTVRSLMYLQSIEAYGTSEGVSKAWDSRGRGKAMLESHGFEKKGNSWVKKTQYGADPHVFQVNEDGSWYHGMHGKYVSKPFGSGKGLSSAESHLQAKYGSEKKFGEGAKSRPAGGYGQNEDESNTESKPKFGEGHKSRPSWGY